MVDLERELAQLEKRLVALREQLARRRKNKQDIVDLQSKVVLNQAKGLELSIGVPGNDASRLP
jgi:hypothetical protein